MSESLIKKEIILSPEHLCLYRNNVAKGSNFIYSDKGFVQRKALSTNESRIMFDYSSGYKGYGTIIPTDTYIYINSQRAKVVIVQEWEDLEGKHKILWFKLVFADGTFQDIGSINLSGHSPGTSADIDSFTLYSGKGVRGSGLFFIITKSYFKTGEKEVGIYELSKDLSKWTALSGDDMYAPTVFFNGKGESYYIAYNNDPTYKLEAPRYLESKNLLSGAFKSYFTTDGYSFAFSLPFDNLTNEEVTCTYKYDRETEFTWTIKEGHSFSECVSLEGKEIALHCDREKGRMVFRTKSGELYSLTRSNETNNIWFKAYKTDTDNIMKVASMNIAVGYSGKSNDCAMTVFAGSKLYPSSVLWIDSNNPLYFPESCQTQIGDIKEKITSLTVQGGGLLAFKETQLFKGRFVSAEGYQIDGVLAGVKGSGSIKESEVSFDLVSSLPDIPIARTVKENGGTVFFATKSGGVYALKGERGKVTEISPVGTFEGPAFAVLDEGDYMLFTKDKSFLLWDTRELKSPCWYEQKYPVKVLEGANVSSSAIFFCTTGYEYSPILYNCLLKGEKDSFFTFNNAIFLKEQSIETKLELELIKGFNTSRLSRLNLAGESYFETNVLVKNGESPFFAKSLFDMLKGTEFLCGGIFSKLILSISFGGAFRLGGVGCFYRSLKK